MTNSHTHTLPSNPLFSTIITLYTLILLYFPSTFYRVIFFSPVFLSTSLLLLSLLRLGATQKPDPNPCHASKWVSRESNVVFNTDPVPFYTESSVDCNAEQDREFDPEPKPKPAQIPNHDNKWVAHNSNVDSTIKHDPDIDPGPDPILNPDPFYAEYFVEWNVRAPLEVIHEDYEGEEEIGVTERYASLSLYYPETHTDTDTDSLSGGESPVIGNWENMGFQWEEEELIEIELEGKRRSMEAEDDENLIEIDLNFHAR